MNEEVKDFILKKIDDYDGYKVPFDWYDRHKNRTRIIFTINNLKKSTTLIYLLNIINSNSKIKKILIKNRYGILSNLLYKYRNELDDEFLYEMYKKVYVKECLWSLSDKVNMPKNIIDRIINDKEVILKLLKQAGYVLKYVSDRLKDDKEVVLEAVKHYGYALEYASNESKDDKKVIKVAIEQSGSTLFLTINKELLIEILKNDVRTLEFVNDEIMEDREFVEEIIKVVKYDIWSLRYISNRLKNDKYFIIEMALKYNLVLEFLDEELANDKEFMELLLIKDKYYLRYVGFELINDKDFILKFIDDERVELLDLISSNVRILECASDELINDKEFMIEAIKVNGNAIYYVGNKLLNDQDIIKIRNAILILDYD